jgi:hypothetical protein
MEAHSKEALEELNRRPASQSCKLVDFDEAEVRPGFVTGTWFLVVRGNAPCANMRVELVPLVYVQRPDYWEIEVVGCLAGGLCLPQAKPFTEVLPLDGILGTAGIEVVGASRRQKIKVP